MEEERARQVIETLRARNVFAHVKLPQAGITQYGVRVVLPDGREAIWDNDGTGGPGGADHAQRDPGRLRRLDTGLGEFRRRRRSSRRSAAPTTTGRWDRPSRRRGARRPLDRPRWASASATASGRPATRFRRRPATAFRCRSRARPGGRCRAGRGRPGRAPCTRRSTTSVAAAGSGRPGRAPGPTAAASRPSPAWPQPAQVKRAAVTSTAKISRRSPAIALPSSSCCAS